MSVSVSPSEEVAVPFIPVNVRMGRENRAGRQNQANDDRSTLMRKLPIVREMLASLGTLSAAGQHYIMSKVIAFVETEAGRLREQIGPRNEAAFTVLLQDLTRQSDRLWPDVPTFSRRADSLLALLGRLSW